MRIVYFYQYFTTPKGSWSTRVYEFTKYWVEQGHDVSVVTSIYSKSDLKASKFLESQTIDGIKLKIINIRIDNKQPIIKRIFTFLGYSLFSMYYSLILPCDVVISSSGPITAGIPGLFAKFFRRKKMVFEVRDLWPEAPIELGVLKNKLIQKLSYKFEEMCYANSKLVVGLSPGIQNNIKTRFPKTNVISVTNSANIELFNTPKTTLKDELLKNKKFAIYTGNIGRVNNSDLLFRSAVLLKKMERDDIHIVLIGDGQQKDDLEQKSKDLKNFHILDLMPKTELVNYIKNAFVSVIPLHNTPMLSTSSPNKLFESMAASVPVIQTTDGWIKNLLEETKSGFSVSPTDEHDMVEKLIYLADHSQETEEMGKNAFEYAVINFDKNILSQKMLTHIEQIVNPS